MQMSTFLCLKIGRITVCNAKEAAPNLSSWPTNAAAREEPDSFPEETKAEMKGE